MTKTMISNIWVFASICLSLGCSNGTNTQQNEGEVFIVETEKTTDSIADVVIEDSIKNDVLELNAEVIYSVSETEVISKIYNVKMDSFEFKFINEYDPNENMNWLTTHGFILTNGEYVELELTINSKDLGSVDFNESEFYKLSEGGTQILIKSFPMNYTGINQDALYSEIDISRLKMKSWICSSNLKIKEALLCN